MKPYRQPMGRASFLNQTNKIYLDSKNNSEMNEYECSDQNDSGFESKVEDSINAHQ